MPQQMLKMLPSWPNAVGTTAEDDVYSLEFLAGNWWNADGVLEIFQNMRIYFMHFIS